MLKMQDNEETEPFIVLLTVSLIVGRLLPIILFSTTYLVKFLTKKGLDTAELLIRVILAALSVQLILKGISRYLNK